MTGRKTNRNYLELRQVKGAIELSIPMFCGEAQSLRIDPALYRLVESFDIRRGVFRLRGNVRNLRVNARAVSGTEYYAYKSPTGVVVRCGAFLLCVYDSCITVEYNERRLLYVGLSGWGKTPLKACKNCGVFEYADMEENILCHVISMV